MPVPPNPAYAAITFIWFTLRCPLTALLARQLALTHPTLTRVTLTYLTRAQQSDMLQTFILPTDLERVR
jgi:hypothetical protein